MASKTASRPGGGASYPGFNVMAARSAWDPFTRSVISQRLRPGRLHWLSEAEARTLRAAARRLLAEERPEVLAFVVAHFDQRLGAGTGEGQRAPDVPPEAELVRRGLAALDAVARRRAGEGGGAGDPDTATGFDALPASEQDGVLSELAAGRLEPADALAGTPQKPLFQKLLGLAADALASHPSVWSEIGYAGPAYPRGYYRMGRGILDPWEPRAAKPGEAGNGGRTARAARRAGPDAGRSRTEGTNGHTHAGNGASPALAEGQPGLLDGHAVGNGRRNANGHGGGNGRALGNGTGTGAPDGLVAAHARSGGGNASNAAGQGGGNHHPPRDAADADRDRDPDPKRRTRERG